MGRVTYVHHYVRVCVEVGRLLLTDRLASHSLLFRSHARSPS